MENQTFTYTFIGITWVTMLGLFVMFTLLYLSYRNKIQKQLDERRLFAFKASIEAEESLKERIANNIHDEVMALTSAVISGIDNSIREYQESRLSIEGLENAKYIASQLNESLKYVSRELMPRVLTEIGFVQALNRHLHHLNNSEMTLSLKNNTPFDTELPLEKKEEVHLYRICLEVLNNLKKHDRFTFLEVLLSTNANNLIIKFRHDGSGISQDQIEEFTSSGKGLGLNSINSRLLILSGSISYSLEKTSPEIEIRIPIKL